MLPSFLLAKKSFAVAVVKELLTTSIKNPHDWKQLFDIEIDLATVYRWLRILTQQANEAMSEMRKALLKLKSDYQLTEQINGKPAPLTPRSKLLQRFMSLAQKLNTEAVRLIDKNKPISTDYFCFLNYFLANHTAKPLLQA